MKFNKTLSNSETLYKWDVKRSWTKQQSSYNLSEASDDLWEYLTEGDNPLIEKDEEKTSAIQRPTETVYSLSEYSFKLGPNVIFLIGEEFDNDKNQFIASIRQHESGTGKPQMYKKTYKDLGKGFEWFSKLYDKNFSDTELVFSIDDNEKTLTLDVEFPKLVYPKKLKFHSYNRIFFGAPGTGKSFTLNEEKKHILGDGYQENFERVTFHPDYSYAQFVGTYKPVPDENDSKIINYKYVPGPFIRILIDALINKNQKYVLIIEEINRANVASVFGDIFQLLDRNAEGNSQFPINASEDMKNFLEDELKKKLKDKYRNEYSEIIYIPKNLYLWATMNSADQGVFMMDSAFKRRWDFTYIDINHDDDKIEDNVICFENKTKLNWNSLRKAINSVLLDLGINEDKLLGPFFIPINYLLDDKKFIEIFRNKVLMYLFEDVAKHKREHIFNKKFKTHEYFIYSDIYNNFETNGIKIFHENIIKEYNNYEDLKKSTD